MILSTGVRAVIAAGIIAASFSTVSYANTIRSGFDISTLPANDDGSTGPVALGFAANFFGTTYSQTFVNNNGNVTFGGPLSTFTPFDLNSTATPIIAPFFADVDTGNGVGDEVTYGTGTVNGQNAFGVNYIDVNYFNNGNDNGILNSFQLVLIDRTDTGVGNFDIEFNYGDILWEAGTASGSDANGLGGSSARAGFSAGTGTPGSFFELEGSAINGAFLNGGPNELISGSNIGTPGRFVFSARNGDVIDPGPSAVPLPASLPLLLAAFGALGLARRRQS